MLAIETLVAVVPVNQGYLEREVKISFREKLPVEKWSFYFRNL